MYSEDLKRLRKKLRKDKQFLKVVKFFNNVANEISISGFYNEISSLHKRRSSRTLNRGEKSFLDKVVEADLQDLAYRSRIAEIELACVQTVAEYGPILDDLVVYLRAEYLEELRGFFKAKGEQEEFCQSLCKNQVKFIRDVKTVQEAARIVVTDIDKSSFRLSNLIEVAKIAHGRKT